MARIRSIHPSFFTDEACVSCSPLARLLYIGLWTDADDQGLFEWKALQIKMRLLPGDNADANDLLAELTGAGLIAEFSSGGKRFGAIRDFRSYQRPKKPNSVHVLPPEWRTYVGLDSTTSEPEAVTTPPASEPVPHQFPTEGEKSPQMEDGGEDVREEDIGTSSLLAKQGDPIAANDAGPSTALALVPPTSRSAKARGAKFVPEDWQPSAAHIAKAADLRVNLDREVERFRLHEFKDPKSNFDLAFHRWLNNAADGFGAPPVQSRAGGRREPWNALDQAAEGFDWSPEDAA